MNKDYINGFGCCFAWFVALAFGFFVWWCQLPPKEIGYTMAHRAELQAKFENMVPLSTADIGYE